MRWFGGYRHDESRETVPGFIAGQSGKHHQ
jgi:hypothetical protein